MTSLDGKNLTMHWAKTREKPTFILVMLPYANGTEKTHHRGSITVGTSGLQFDTASSGLCKNLF